MPEVIPPVRQRLHWAVLPLGALLIVVFGIGLAWLQFQNINRSLIICPDDPSDLLEAGGRFALFVECLFRAIAYPVLLSGTALPFWILAWTAPRRRARWYLAAMTCFVLVIAAAMFWLDFTWQWTSLSEYGQQFDNMMYNRCPGGWPPWWPSLGI